MTETRRESGSWKAKHGRILAAALDEFIGRGFTGGSMDRIAVKAKVSKVTIYNHFENKELLYRSMIDYYLTQVHPSPPVLQRRRELSPQDILSSYAFELIEMTTHPKSVGMFRLLRSDPLQVTDVPSPHHVSQLLPDLAEMTSYFAWEHEGGRLNVIDHEVAARQLIGMLFENSLYPAVLGLSVDLSKPKIQALIGSSVTMFLAHYQA